jgi:hypothetical protein
MCIGIEDERGAFPSWTTRKGKEVVEAKESAGAKRVQILTPALAWIEGRPVPHSLCGAKLHTVPSLPGTHRKSRRQRRQS